MKKHIAIGALCVVLFALGCEENLVKNPDFSQTGPKGEPTGWTFAADKTGKGTATVEGGVLKLVNTSDKGRVSLSQRFRVWRDTPYAISVRMKADGGVPIFQVAEDVRGVKYDKKYDHYLERGYTGPWKTFEFKLKTAPKTRSIGVNLGLRNKGVAWFDDVRVIPLTDNPPPPLPEDLVKLTPWRTSDDIIDGWDWSLPPGVKPVPYSGFVTGMREERIFPGNKLTHLRATWKQCEPKEGVYNFDWIKERIKDVPPEFIGVEFGLYGATSDVVPQWLLDKYKPKLIDMGDVEGRFRLYNVPIWDERIHKRYLKLVEAFGKTGIPQMKELLVTYVHGISKSRGEEFWMPRDVATWCEQNVGLTPERMETCMKERLAAWADAYKGVEYKLSWVGAGGGFAGKREYDGLGDRLIEYAYKLGMGQRCGFIEMYTYHFDNPWLGQRLGDDGYLTVDETCPPIAEGRAFGDENEEYSKVMQVRFGPMETFPHRYRESMLRTLQMRRNFLWISPMSVDTNPPLTAYVSMELGRKVEDTPDVWCYLRESYARKKNNRKEARPIKNFERWLHQRDREGYKTVPVCKVKQHERLWIAPKTHKYDLTARRTDRASGNDKIGFAVDDRFLSGGPHKVAVKITYRDIGKGAWLLAYRTPQGESTREVRCTGTNKVKTATFFLDDACFPAKGMDFDFEIRAVDGDATVSFVRVVKVR
ncbi:MAG: hypothetical protein GXP25_17925 [Planctomycetes bacterium]|nr:hypothetical protein [Planctomycetota bacterium]